MNCCLVGHVKYIVFSYIYIVHQFIWIYVSIGMWMHTQYQNHGEWVSMGKLPSSSGIGMIYVCSYERKHTCRGISAGRAILLWMQLDIMHLSKQRFMVFDFICEQHPVYITSGYSFMIPEFKKG